MIGVRAAVDDLRHTIAESLANRRAGRGAALVLHGVVQQGGDRLAFVGAVLQRNARHAEQMRHVRHTAALARLLGMQLRGVRQGVVETVG